MAHSPASMGYQSIHDFTTSVQDEFVIVRRILMEHSAGKPERGLHCTRRFTDPMADPDARFFSFRSSDPGVGSMIVPFRVGNWIGAETVRLELPKNKSFLFSGSIYEPFEPMDQVLWQPASWNKFHLINTSFRQKLLKSVKTSYGRFARFMVATLQCLDCRVIKNKSKVQRQ